MKNEILALIVSLLIIVVMLPISCTPTTVEEEEIAETQEDAEEEAFLSKCPITCLADSEGWEVIFECEEEGQRVTKTYYPGFTTEFKDGKAYVHGSVEFTFETSGNVYQATIDISPCSESNTGYCITVEATGDTLGNESIKCQNF